MVLWSSQVCGIHLGKLGLSVGSEVFVTEASRKLVVPTDTAGHENLLVLLRALGKGVC